MLCECLQRSYILHTNGQICGPGLCLNHVTNLPHVFFFTVHHVYLLCCHHSYHSVLQLLPAQLLDALNSCDAGGASTALLALHLPLQV